MVENSAISWTTHTFSGWWGCTKVGPGCDHCYADAFDHRVGGDHWGPGKPRRLVKDWSKPLKWQREAERTGERPWVFASSMCDVFDNEIPPEWRARLWDIVRKTPLLRWQILTKRIGNAAKMLPPDWREAFGHCGLMATVVNQDEADRDIPKLLATPAAWRGLSMEPLLGPVDLTKITTSTKVRGKTFRDELDALTGEVVCLDTGCCPDPLPGLDWVIIGGESGPQARPMDLEWVWPIMDQCAAAGVACFVKQLGRSARMNRFDAAQPVALGAGWQAEAPGSDHGIVKFRDPHGGNMDEWPSRYRVREMPAPSVPTPASTEVT